MADRRILVIEDEILIGIDIVSALEAAGFEQVEHVSTEAEALHRIASESWSAIVADANLNGRSVERVIDALQTRSVPYLILTGYARENLSGLVGNAPVLSKPFAASTLVHTLNGLLQAPSA